MPSHKGDCAGVLWRIFKVSEEAELGMEQLVWGHI